MVVCILQMLIFITHYVCLKHMAAGPIAGFETEGLWWFLDLSAGDVYCALPVICCLTLFINIEVHSSCLDQQTWARG